jgi:hypothetical protein
MKKYFLTIMLLSGLSVFALPTKSGKSDKPVATSTAVSAETSSTVTLKQLQEENILLKQQLLALTNENEEITGRLAYQATMVSVLAKLSEQRQSEQLAELKAQIDYNRMMSSLLIRLQNR